MLLLITITAKNYYAEKLTAVVLYDDVVSCRFHGRDKSFGSSLSVRARIEERGDGTKQSLLPRIKDLWLGFTKIRSSVVGE